MQKVNHRHLLLVILFIYLFIFIMVMDKNSGIFFYLGYKGEAQSGEISWQEGDMGAS